MKINSWKYYILDFSDLSNPGLVRFRFDTKKQAKGYIKRYITAIDTVTIIWGYDAKKKGYDFLNKKKSKNSIKPYKYKYPKHVTTAKKRKFWRENIRRWKSGKHKPRKKEHRDHFERFL